MSLERYVREARKAKCPQDQLDYFLRADLVLQPRQLAASAAARRCDRSRGPIALGYGGARGGGKSFWLLAQMGADDCQRRPGLKCLLLRKVGKANLEHFEDLRRQLFHHLPHRFNSVRGTLTFENGSQIVAGHFQCEKDIDAYLGLEYDVIGIEEATTLTHRKYVDITTCLRTSKRDWRPRIYATANPGGVGHGWYKALFVQPHFERISRRESKQVREAPAGSVAPACPLAKSPVKAGNGASYRTLFIPAKVSDNACNNPDYETRVLSQLTGWRRRAWLDGDWDIQAGQFFTTFRRECHVIDAFDPRRAVEWFVALDYGFTHVTAVLLGCRDGDGRVFVLDEHAERRWLPERHAAAIHAMLSRHGLEASDLRRFVAGPDCFSAQFDGTTIARQYADCGLTLTPANADRINGWADVLRLLGDLDAGIAPKLFIHSRCARLLGELPALEHDPGRPEDVLKLDSSEEGEAGDDCADALRYLVHSRAPGPKWCG
ncbi:MAG: terminase family protein [Verrucomicrobia subdivision 3 bacterium]|nr:terminase family protein [Limisphaerales bacterium]